MSGRIPEGMSQRQIPWDLYNLLREFYELLGSDANNERIQQISTQEFSRFHGINKECDYAITTALQALESMQALRDAM